MPTPTYDLIEEKVLGSAQASVTFSSIPGTYKDLVLEYIGTNSDSNAGITIRCNGDTGANYSGTYLNGFSSGISSTRQNARSDLDIFFGSTTLTNAVANFMGYSSTNFHKNIIVRDNANGDAVRASVLRWANSSAITSIQVSRLSGATISTNAVFRLWGVFG